jgi:hypothetical protein
VERRAAEPRAAVAGVLATAAVAVVVAGGVEKVAEAMPPLSVASRPSSSVGETTPRMPWKDRPSAEAEVQEAASAEK